QRRMEFSAFNRPTKFPFSWLTLFERVQAGSESSATQKNNPQRSQAGQQARLSTSQIKTSLANRDTST
ncbi:hypothetical protein, partial [Paraburkholderia graminis]|uniref:hypothetical protein n=1 Tax=Paraburkholderia graminis TaxID=60548 RepID=UPI0038BAB530